MSIEIFKSLIDHHSSSILKFQTMSPTFEHNSIVDDKYRIDRLIGSGGMGQVYAAVHQVIGRDVALKILHEHFQDNDEIAARFHQEAQTAGSIGHDNICEIIDVGITNDGIPYLVMPLLKGMSLGQLLKKQGCLSIESAISVSRQVLSALDATHKKRIVHRDLKPDNIYLTTVGSQTDFVKLLDFGISKYIDPEGDLELTQPGQVPGTPYYMAPELSQAIPTDYRVDIYSMGVLLYQMISGKRPFLGMSYQEVIQNALTKPFVLPSVLVPTVTPDLEQIIVKAMARNPRDRFSSAAEMSHALEEVTPNTTHDQEDANLLNSSTDVALERPFEQTADRGFLAHSAQVIGTKKKFLLLLGILVVISFSIITIIISNNDAEPMIIKTPIFNANQKQNKDIQHTSQSPKLPALTPDNTMSPSPNSSPMHIQAKPDQALHDHPPASPDRLMPTSNHSKSRAKVRKKKKKKNLETITGDNETLFISEYGD
ncbi:MAG: serine/threonine-protein kinase [Myxococcota bacterium]|nr:serine/threonine-protein kinase [Myxococcota bacterium]